MNVMLLILLVIGSDGWSNKRNANPGDPYPLDKWMEGGLSGGDNAIEVKSRVTKLKDHYLYVYEIANKSKAQTFLVNWTVPDHFDGFGEFSTLWELKAGEHKLIMLKHKEPPVWWSRGTLRAFRRKDAAFHFSMGGGQPGPLPQSLMPAKLK
jgi:hypothetical protein